jgi:arsenite oxidase small subunit
MKDDDFVCLTRRGALLAGSGGVALSIALPGVLEGATGQPSRLDLALYPEKRVGRISRLVEGEPAAFTYPLEAQPNILVKLGAQALRGVGPGSDVVAFSTLCTHMGGSLQGRYRHDLRALGPCPFHFSTFDLRKGGIPVHASATQALPQVILRIDGDDIVAVGVIGLIYGQRNNLEGGDLAQGATPGRPGAPSITRG